MPLILYTIYGGSFLYKPIRAVHGAITQQAAYALLFRHDSLYPFAAENVSLSRYAAYYGAPCFRLVPVRRFSRFDFAFACQVYLLDSLLIFGRCAGFWRWLCVRRCSDGREIVFNKQFAYNLTWRCTDAVLHRIALSRPRCGDSVLNQQPLQRCIM